MTTLSDLTSADGIDAALALPGLLLLDVYTQDCVVCRRLEPMVAAVAASSGGAVQARKLEPRATSNLPPGTPFTGYRPCSSFARAG